MNDVTILGTTISLPAPPTGWFDYGYSVLCNGDLALVRTDSSIRTGYSRLRLSKFDGYVEIGAIEVPAVYGPGVDCLADGRWLVVSRRAAPKENNARLFATDGTPAGAFAMGDGINHIRCAADGTIWVGYFDEGVFSASSTHGHWPVSSSGLARFGPDGSVLWGFNDDEGTDPSVDDCYALALDGNTVWCCPYIDFPIVRVKDGVVDHWKNDVAEAGAIAVDGDYVLLAGGYNDESNRLALLHLENDRARPIGEWRFRPPERNTARLVQGAGATLHIVGQGRWTKLSLSAVRAALGT